MNQFVWNCTVQIIKNGADDWNGPPVVNDASFTLIQSQ